MPFGLSAAPLREMMSPSWLRETEAVHSVGPLISAPYKLFINRRGETDGNRGVEK